MTRITVDDALGARLAEAHEPVVICDPAGRVLGSFRPFSLPASSAEAKALSPFSDEEIEELRKQRTGRPLSQILADLENEHGR